MIINILFVDDLLLNDPGPLENLIDKCLTAEITSFDNACWSRRHFSEDSWLLNLCRSEFGKGSKTLEEAPIVGKGDKTSYLRPDNVKFNEQFYNHLIRRRGFLLFL